MQGLAKSLNLAIFQIGVQLILVLVYGQFDAHQPSVPQRRCWIMTETVSLFVAFNLDDTTKIVSSIVVSGIPSFDACPSVVRTPD